MDDLTFNEILTREPFYMVLPEGYMQHRKFMQGTKVSEPIDKLTMRIVTQADFLRQYYPTGHAINDSRIFPDIYKRDPETKKFYVQPITRCSFAFQQIIAIKQIIHIVGNDIQMELSEKSDNVKEEEENVLNLLKFRTGWLEKSMELRFFEAVRSFKITGDTAVVGFIDKNDKFHAKTLSYLNGDTLYPHFDPITGELSVFARKYYDLDDDGNKVTEWVEVWDDKNFYRAKADANDAKGGIKKATAIIREFFGISGYKIVEKKPHGFNFVPVTYFRNEEGACWLAAQDTIEQYEEAFSYFCENNKAFAFPIMYIKGDGVDFVGDLNGAVKAVEIDNPEGDVGFIKHQDTSASFNTELENLYKMIYEQAFTVKPPELKSGDLPGVALKLLYSPAIELAIHDCSKLQPFLDRLILIFKHGYGYEMGMEATMANLKINAWIQPYVHQNQTEIATNLATAVQNGFLSKRTASERMPDFPKNDEYERIMREDKEKRQRDLFYQVKELEAKTDEDIKKANATSGQDVNTGNGGRPNESGRIYDENGNWEGRNNWDGWNKTH